MSFQGDVAGIGLGELLQGLARGGRDGVLTLYGDRLTASLGLKGSQLFLLAGPDEKDDDWRERVQRAFAEDPLPQMETNRRLSIARAHRMETIYLMLEELNLHFRFEPGPLPTPPNYAVQLAQSIALEDGDSRKDESPWGAGLTVEYVLLEQARISDESQNGAAAWLQSFDIPRALDPSQHPPDVRDFLEQCNGTSTLLEISDRLGWPMSQTRASVGQYLEAGLLRLAQPRELLAAAQRELELGRVGRAATRLAGWIEASPPGPPPVGDADLLVGEWEQGRLTHVLHALGPKDARALFRKLDHVHKDAQATRDRWRTLFETHRGDEIAMIHEVALRLAATDEPEARVFHDLLRLGRAFQERGHEARTRTLLRLAASHLPSRPQTRVELGKRMLETGLVEEGTSWLLDTSRELIDIGEPEKALVPIRSILRVVPDHGEASSLLFEARTLQSKQKRRRWNTLVGLSIGLMLSLVAFVKFRSYREVERWVTEINSLVREPDKALGMLDQAFPEDPPERIVELRKRLLQLQREENRRRYDDWHRYYQEIEDLCRFGDPLLGLRRTMELEAPPTVERKNQSFPERQDLLGALAARLGDRSEELDLPVEATIEDLNQEERLADLLEEILTLVALDTAPPEAISFHFRITELHREILDRREERAIAREELLEGQKLRQQDILLATARAHAAAGDLKRSLAAYDRLTESDEELAELPELQREIEKVRDHHEALTRALELASLGDHLAAEEELLGVCERPIEHLLPFQVDSRPTGATVTMSDGRVRVTPFRAKSGIGEVMEFRFEHPGRQSRTIRLDKPSDQMVFLHRFPERAWNTNYRVEAAPVPAGDDHVVADRFGRIRRLDRDSNSKWERELNTLGGIARTPIFLPGKPGHLLVVSEDGQAWLVNAANGEVLGPRDINAPPIRGPELTRGGASVQFADGRVAVWTDRLEPVFYNADTTVQSGSETDRELQPSSTMVVLRRGVDRELELVSPWNDWRAEVRPDDFRVISPEGKGFTAERHGEWTFVAWEAPKAFVPHGRLWVSDEQGLRSYLPDREDLVNFTRGQ